MDLQPLKTPLKPLNTSSLRQPWKAVDTTSGAKPMPHLPGDIRFDWTSDTDHEFRDMRKVDNAAAAIGRIPNDTDVFHLVVAGKHSLWNMVQAVLKMAAPATIETLHIATLGFSRNSISEMTDLLDSGAIGRLVLLCSHYFRCTSDGIWEQAAAEFAKRHNAKLITIRSHAKILAMKLTDGKTVTIEASANLRSCKSIEHATVFGQPGAREFHAGWIEAMADEQEIARRVTEAAG